MVKVSRLSGGYAWAIGLAGSGLGLMLMHEILQQPELWSSQNPLEQILPISLSPESAETRSKESFPLNELIAQLQEADDQWQPRQEILPDGSTRYLYKRRTGEPDLSVSQLRQLIETPPTFHKERQDVLDLFSTLQAAGVKVHLSPTIKKGAAAEWDHRLGTLRIQPQMTNRGSVDFLELLSHEAIHVAQSCRGGSLKARPKPLGLTAADSSKLRQRLNDPVYKNTSHWELTLEREAYGGQNNPDQVKQILQRECKLAINMAN
ncbi:MAG: hypothetical protein ACK40D_11075 [Cyanobacteriota bacterium]|jgi:hypothetical protein